MTSTATTNQAISTNPPTADPTNGAPAASARTWIAVLGSTLGAFMAVLNIQITNASLADIQGGIGAGIDDSGWISTSYLIAEIIVIPLTAWLAQIFSLRRYLLVNAVLFLVFSAACALALVARLAQRMGKSVQLTAVAVAIICGTIEAGVFVTGGARSP